MTNHDKQLLVAILARFADDVGKLPAMDKFFLARLERALSTVMEGRLKHLE